MVPKWLDNVAIDNSIWWQHILGLLDCRNGFSAFEIRNYLKTIGEKYD